MKFHKFHKFPPISPVFGPAVLARKKDSNSYAFSMVAALMFPPRAPQNMFFLKYWLQTKILGVFMKICEIQLQNWFLKILRGPWPARAGNLNIPIGILRFLSLPGPHGSLQNRKKLKIPAQNALFHSKTGFSASGAKKSPQNVMFMQGFGQGPPMSIFGPPDAFLVPRIIKGGILQDSIGFYRIIGIQPASQPASRGLQLKDILKDILKDFLKEFLKDFLYTGYP